MGKELLKGNMRDEGGAFWLNRSNRILAEDSSG